MELPEIHVAMQALGYWQNLQLDTPESMAAQNMYCYLKRALEGTPKEFGIQSAISDLPKDRSAMKIKILKCSDPTMFWYAKHVGEIFNVTSEHWDSYETDFPRDPKDSYTKWLVHKVDCKVLVGTKKEAELMKEALGIDCLVEETK